MDRGLWSFVPDAGGQLSFVRRFVGLLFDSVGPMLRIAEIEVVRAVERTLIETGLIEAALVEGIEVVLMQVLGKLMRARNGLVLMNLVEGEEVREVRLIR